MNGTVSVGNETYRWNANLGRYLEAGSNESSAFTGNWSRLDDDCYTSSDKVFVGAACMLPDACTERRWVLEGDGCDSVYVPDVFFLSVILFLGTFGLAMFCRNFRSTGYFPSWVSKMQPIFTSAKEVMFLPVFVRLCVCVQDNSKSYRRHFLKF